MILILTVAVALISGAVALAVTDSDKGGGSGAGSDSGTNGATATGLSGTTGITTATGETGVDRAAEPVPKGLDGPLLGVNLTAYTPSGYGLSGVRRDVQRIAELDSTAVTVVPTWYMNRSDSFGIKLDPRKTPTDESLRQVIDWIKSSGMKVVLKPHVDVLDGTFRGDIQPMDGQAWNRAYRRFIEHYAAIAAERDVDLFVVGTELKSRSGDTGRWRSLITSVRSRFTGPLTYAANWDEVEQIQFWDALDAIGVDAYYPLSDEGSIPGRQELIAAWKPTVESLRALSERWQRPVLLTEVGYPTQAGATAHPWEVREDEPADQAAQLNAYRATFEAFEGEDWLAGISWWSWRADHSSEESPAIDYSPEGKAAEGALAEGQKRLK